MIALTALMGDKVGLALTGAKVKVTGAAVVGAALTGAKVIGTLTAVGARLTGAAVIGATEIGADEVGDIVLIVTAGVGASVITVEMVGSCRHAFGSKYRPTMICKEIKCEQSHTMQIMKRSTSYICNSHKTHICRRRCC